MSDVKTKILLADDQTKVRSALRLLLEQEDRWQIVAEVGDASTLSAAMALTSPDIILLDWELPGLQGKKSVAGMRSCCPHVKIVALSSQVDARKEARKAQVDAFVSKGDPPNTVLTTLRSLGVRKEHYDPR